MKVPVETDVSELPPEVLDTEESSVHALASAYRDIYDEVEIKERELKRLKAGKEYLATKLYDTMTENGLDAIKTEDGSFSPKLKSACSIVPAFQEAVFEHLEEIGHGDSIKRTVAWATLNKLYRDGKLDGIKGSEVIKEWDRKTISIRRSGERP